MHCVRRLVACGGRGVFGFRLLVGLLRFAFSPLWCWRGWRPGRFGRFGGRPVFLAVGGFCVFFSFRAFCGVCAVLAGFGSVGFSGSRRLSGAAFGRCRGLAAAAAAAGSAVSVGCARGADAAARLGAPGASVFRVVGSGRGAFVGRSVRFVRALAAAPSPLLVSFPGGPCPAGVVPGPSWCGGSGSGSWASLALAVGLGVSVRVFLPAGVAPPAGWGSWSRVGAGVFAGSWVLRPVARQLALF